MAATTSLTASASDEYFTYCNETTHQSYFDQALTIPDTRADSAEICNLPTADAADIKNTRRCINAEKMYCQFGAGGEGSTSGVHPHNVPTGAYYSQPGVGVYSEIRCICGCFPGETRMLTSHGWSPMKDLAASTASSPFAVAISSRETPGISMAPQATGRDFVVGPEEKPVISIETAHGETLTLTENHPVLLSTEHGPDMIPARELKRGDKVVTTDGEATAVTSLSQGRLPADDNTVYNVDSRQGEMKDRIVHVNGLRMGDVVWQNRLSSLQGRIAALMQ